MLYLKSILFSDEAISDKYLSYWKNVYHGHRVNKGYRHQLVLH